MAGKAWRWRWRWRRRLRRNIMIAALTLPLGRLGRTFLYGKSPMRLMNFSDQLAFISLRSSMILSRRRQSRTSFSFPSGALGRDSGDSGPSMQRN